MSAAIDPNQPEKTTGSRSAWFQPVYYAFLAALAILLNGMCCWSPLINLFLPVPPCMGGYGSENAQDVRTMVFFDMAASAVSLPIALLLSALSGLAVYFLLRNRKSRSYIKWCAALVGVLIGLVFDIAVPLIINRIICTM